GGAAARAALRGLVAVRRRSAGRVAGHAARRARVARSLAALGAVAVAPVVTLRARWARHGGGAAARALGLIAARRAVKEPQQQDERNAASLTEIPHTRRHRHSVPRERTDTVPRKSVGCRNAAVSCGARP